ncbi:hypothetical protein C453_12641 [Haloferax elongans ATCC BAA-1513]|uniref:Uncharacterized protein n=1 Tax=Haloferax elongans ATCC BAA-1513 TaxID=1230453 RepID=M0HKR7_HALEO|nr:hypothetical protein [Haloferax elongans]ELZ84393.1 hypothetical protein C453_12641 [Haloferax elongans ATCC BAA-1513]
MAEDQEFGAGATLAVEVDRQSLRHTREVIQDGIGDVEVAVRPGAMSPSVRMDGGTASAGGGDATLSMLADEVQRHGERRSKEAALGRQLQSSQLEVQKAIWETLDDIAHDVDGLEGGGILGGGIADLFLEGGAGAAGEVVGELAGELPDTLGDVLGTAAGEVLGRAVSDLLPTGDASSVSVEEPEWTPLQVETPGDVGVDQPQWGVEVEKPGWKISVEEPPGNEPAPHDRGINPDPLLDPISNLFDDNELQIPKPDWIPISVDDPSPLSVEEVDPLQVEEIEPISVSVSVSTTPGDTSSTTDPSQDGEMVAVDTGTLRAGPEGAGINFTGPSVNSDGELDLGRYNIGGDNGISYDGARVRNVPRNSSSPSTASSEPETVNKETTVDVTIEQGDITVEASSIDKLQRKMERRSQKQVDDAINELRRKLSL